MPPLAGSIITRVRDEQESPDRGLRQWSMLEIQDSTWYQIETRPDDVIPADIRTFITTDLDQALAQLQTLRGNSWTQLRMYTRLPLRADVGYVLEPIDRIFKMPNGERLIFLRSGLTLKDKGPRPEMPPRFEEASEIYCCR